MVRGNGEQNALLTDDVIDKAVVISVVAKAEIAFSVMQSLLDLIGIHLADFDIDLRILRSEAGEEIGERDEGFCLCHDDGQLFVVIGDHAADIVVLKKHSPRAFKKKLSACGQGDRIGISVKQLRAELLFETDQLLTQRRLGDEQLFRRLGNAAVFTDRNKVFQLNKIHIIMLRFFDVII